MGRTGQTASTCALWVAREHKHGFPLPSLQSHAPYCLCRHPSTPPFLYPASFPPFLSLSSPMVHCPSFVGRGRSTDPRGRPGLWAKFGPTHWPRQPSGSARRHSPPSDGRGGQPDTSCSAADERDDWLVCEKPRTVSAVVPGLLTAPHPSMHQLRPLCIPPAPLLRTGCFHHTHNLTLNNIT